MRAVERARSDIAAGQLWKARDRLRGAFVTNPADQEVLELLGDVLFKMGDLPEAARFWVMTERVGADFDAAFAALLERHGGAGRAAPIVPVRTGLATLPPMAQERLGAMKRASLDEFGRRVNLGWERAPTRHQPQTPRTKRERLFEVFAATCFIVIGLIFLTGIVAVFLAGVETIGSMFE